MRESNSPDKILEIRPPRGCISHDMGRGIEGTGPFTIPGAASPYFSAIGTPKLPLTARRRRRRLGCEGWGRTNVFRFRAGRPAISRPRSVPRFCK